MDDELSLPRLPPAQDRPNAFPPARKRARLDDSPAPSSDPPFFSSDDDPSADNYTGPRTKKLHRGPWWMRQRDRVEMESAPGTHKGKRTLTRQMDSGVWLGSDISDGDINEALQEELGAKSLDGRGFERFDVEGARWPADWPEDGPEREMGVFPKEQRKLRHELRIEDVSDLTPEELKSRRVIESCLEEGRETIDLR